MGGGRGQRQFFDCLAPVDVAHPGGTQDVFAGVDGNAREPGFFALDFALHQRVDVRVRLDECFLGRILCRAQVPQIHAAHALDAVAVLAHQPHERLLAGFLRIGCHAAFHLLII